MHADNGDIAQRKRCKYAKNKNLETCSWQVQTNGATKDSTQSFLQFVIYKCRWTIQPRFFLLGFKGSVLVFFIFVFWSDDRKGGYRTVCHLICLCLTRQRKSRSETAYVTSSRSNQNVGLLSCDLGSGISVTSSRFINNTT